MIKNCADVTKYVQSVKREKTSYCQFKYDREWEILNLKVHRGGRKKAMYENTLPGKQENEYYLA
jgi:hypothetical protein